MSISGEFPAGKEAGFLFSESGARYVVSCKPEHEEGVRKLADEFEIPIELSGQTGGEKIEVEGVASISLDSAYSRWKSGMEKFFS